jgi:hypothetical protein
MSWARVRALISRLLSQQMLEFSFLRFRTSFHGIPEIFEIL